MTDANYYRYVEDRDTIVYQDDSGNDRDIPIEEARERLQELEAAIAAFKEATDNDQVGGHTDPAPSRKINISENFKIRMEGELQSIENPATFIRNDDTERLIELQDRLVTAMDDSHAPETVSLLAIIQSELLSRGMTGYRT